MRKLQKGSFTIEASVIIPLLLFTIGLLMMLLFYCHDKSVLTGAAGELAHVKAGRGAPQSSDTGVEKKLLWFRNVTFTVEEEKNEVKVKAEARRWKTRIEIEAAVAVTAPETYIRNIRKIKKLAGGEDENILPDGFE